jgi:transcriptional regulator with XRE-family HTH domain
MPNPRKKPLPKIEMSESIGVRLARFRKRKGFTQEELGNIIGINQYQVSDYETDRLHLSDDMIIRFALTLKVSADTLLGLEKGSEDVLKLKYIKRIMRIDQLPAQKQRDILKTLDMLIKAAEAEQEIE